MPAYYNENDPYAAQWLRNLIEAGHIAPGDVDVRSIVDVRADDLRRYEQAHFFAGIGIWSAALRDAGWSDERPAWTGSCPCQPLSGAGQRKGHADERHLWPAFYALITECKPAKVFGEQVASPDGQEWLGAVRADLEASGYAFGAADLCAAGACVGFGESAEGAATLEWIRGALLHCPDPRLADELRDFAAWAGAELGYGPSHIRQRLYWMGVANGSGRATGRQAGPAVGYGGPAVAGSLVGELANAARERLPRASARPGDAGQPIAPCDGAHCPICSGNGWVLPSFGANFFVPCERCHATGVVAVPASAGRSVQPRRPDQEDCRPAPESGRLCDVVPMGNARGAGLAFGSIAADGRGTIWDEGSPASAHGAHVGSDWIICTDGKARPTQPGILPLVNDWSGPSRVACLRAAGNAIKKELAAEFIIAASEALSVE